VIDLCARRGLLRKVPILAAEITCPSGKYCRAGEYVGCCCRSTRRIQIAVCFERSLAWRYGDGQQHRRSEMRDTTVVWLIAPVTIGVIRINEILVVPATANEVQKESTNWARTATYKIILQILGKQNAYNFQDTILREYYSMLCALCYVVDNWHQYQNKQLRRHLGD